MVQDDSTGKEEATAFFDTLRAGCASISLKLDDDQASRMLAYYQHLCRVNRQINLTRITSPAEAAAKHFVDSLSLLASSWGKQEQCQMLDVGTGAGFPAAPVAIVRPTWAVTAVDGTLKKIRFVREASAAAGISNLIAIHQRAGQLEARDAFSLVTLRAVSKIGPGMREVFRLVQPGGLVVFYKTAQMDEAELAEGRSVAGELGFVTEPPFTISIGGLDEPLNRLLIAFRRK